MRKLRFNIAGLLVVILVLGVSFAALRDANDLWECAVFSLTLGVLLISILLAIHRTGPARAFWLGFALIGWLSMVLTLVPSIEPRLITAKALAYLDSQLPARPSAVYTIQISGTSSVADINQGPSIAFSTSGNQLATSNQAGVRIWDVNTGRILGSLSSTTENFVRIGHSLFALLAGWLGGLLSRRLHARRTESTQGLLAPGSSQSAPGP